MMGRVSSRRAAVGNLRRLVVIGLAIAVCAGGAWAGPPSGAQSRPTGAGQKADDLARAAADRFARAVDHLDVAAAAAECSLPWLNAYREVARDDGALRKSLDVSMEFARRNPGVGVYYRGVEASLPFDQFRATLEANAAERNADQRKQIENLDGLKLTPSDHVVLVRWMHDYSILVRVRDGKATVAGLGPTPPPDARAKMRAEAHPYRQVRSVVYGRTCGAALTLDVLTPKSGANGAAVIYLLSGDFVSQPMPESDEWVLLPLLSRGYTVVTVVHGGLPRFTVADGVRHAFRAVRFTRSHAKEYGIDPNRIGVTGSSSGGYLALMLATARADEPPLADGSDPLGAPDEIDAVSCRVQAAGCYYPPTDWLDYGAEKTSVLDVKWGGPQLRSMLEFREFDKGRFTFVPVTDRAKIEQRLSDLSPARRVTKETAPTFILHGDKDPTVPLQQSQRMVDRLKAAGVPADLAVKTGAGHGWPDEHRDLDQICLWFDRHLARKP
jgi:acetyl esterase/lipase